MVEIRLAELRNGHKPRGRESLPHHPLSDGGRRSTTARLSDPVNMGAYGRALSRVVVGRLGLSSLSSLSRCLAVSRSRCLLEAVDGGRA